MSPERADKLTVRVECQFGQWRCRRKKSKALPGWGQRRECPDVRLQPSQCQNAVGQVGDKLITRRFNYSTTGFSVPEDAHVAVCVLPGTELSFAHEVRRARLWPWTKNVIGQKIAIFRQLNSGCPHAHHDALEFPDREVTLLHLMEGQQATVLQLPAAGREPTLRQQQDAVMAGEPKCPRLILIAAEPLTSDLWPHNGDDCACAAAADRNFDSGFSYRISHLSLASHRLIAWWCRQANRLSRHHQQSARTVVRRSSGK